MRLASDMEATAVKLSISMAATVGLMTLALAGCQKVADNTQAAANAVAPTASAPDPTTVDSYASNAGQPGAAAGEAEADRDLLRTIGGTKHTLIQALQQIEQSGETPTAAKFEYEDGALHLAVYSSAKGTKTDAEHNVLKEHKGDPLKPAWQPGVEVFKDVEHVSRAAEYHTLMELSPYSLANIASKAGSEGAPLWVIPKMAAGKPIFEVAVLKDGQLSRLQYGLMDGEKK
jgi:hypothetical protein